MKKIISLLLVLVLLLASLVTLFSCNDEEEQGSESVSETVGETKETSVTLEETDEFEQNLFISAVPVDELDFQGEAINILSRNSVTHYREWGKDEVGDDVLDQAIQTRNELVASDLNVTVNVIRKDVANFADYLNQFNAFIYNDVYLGIHEYDVVSAFAYGAPNAEIRAYLANMNDKDVFPYFNFELPCWNQAMVDNIIVNDKLFCVAGDLNLSMFDKAMVIWCNKTLYNAQKTADDPDIQDLALSENGWCYADLYNWAQVSENVAGATYDCEKMYGFCCTGATMYDSFVPGWDLELVKTNNDGTHAFNIIGNQKVEDAQEALRSLLKQQGVFPMDEKIIGAKCGCGEGAMGHFAGGTIMFMLDVLYSSEENNLKMRGMDDEFCLLPVPKYEESQENYGTTSADNYNLLTVLDHYESDVPTKGELVSAYLQYATEKSYTDVRGMYFKKIVEPKFFGTNDTDGTVTKSIEIFNLVLDNIEFDVGIIYSPVLNDVGWLWRDNIRTGETLENAFKSNNNSGSGNQRTQEQYEEALAAFDAWMFT